MRSLNALLVLATATSLAACTFNPGAGALTGGGSGNGGTIGTAGTAGRGGSLGTGRGGSSGTGQGGSSTPTEDANCGVTSRPIQAQPADLLIVLDKSGSMANQFNDMSCNNMPNCMDKWNAMVPALNNVVSQTETMIRWGLKYFPNPGGSGTSCAVNNMAQVGVADMNAGPVMTSIAANGPGGRTPTRLAVQAAATYLNGLADTNPKFILLATDGLPNCAPGMDSNADDSDGAVMAVMNAAGMGIQTFVVGIGTIAGGETTLNRLAMAGGRARPTAPNYYAANNGAELATALSTIGGMVASCTFPLTPPPPAPTNIAVHADGATVPKDTGHTNGWDYNGTCTASGPCSIQLFGSYCDRVTSMNIRNVEALYGCPDGPPVP